MVEDWRNPKRAKAHQRGLREELMRSNRLLERKLWLATKANRTSVLTRVKRVFFVPQIQLPLSTQCSQPSGESLHRQIAGFGYGSVVVVRVLPVTLRADPPNNIKR